jgi:hypothetical protein
MLSPLLVPINEWVKKLSLKTDFGNNNFREIDYDIDARDSAVFF